MMYFDLLPEEIIQIIWKFIYNHNLEGIPKSNISFDNDNLRLTVGINKKKERILLRYIKRKI